MERQILTTLTPEELKDLIKEALNEILTVQPKQKDPNEEQLINSKETAAILGISKVTLHKWKLENRVPFYRIGRKVYFKRSEVFNSLKTKKVISRD